MGGAFVLADGHAHVGGCDGVNCDSYNCSFGRSPIYDHRAYRDCNGVDQPLPRYFQPTVDHIALTADDVAGRKRRRERLIDHERDARLAAEVQAIIDAPWEKTVAAPKPPKTELDKPQSKPLPRLGVPWLKPRWVKPTFDVVPLNLLSIERIPAGYTGKNGISHRGEMPRRLTNFCPDCFVTDDDGKVISSWPGAYVTQDHACMPEVYA